MIAFGGGLSSPESGVGDDKAAQVRAQAWRLAARAHERQLSTTQVAIDFRLAAHGDPYAQAARIGALLTRLVATELPTLTRVIRCEARVVRRQSPRPSNGRIDAPRTWLTRRQTRQRVFEMREVRRIADTPVNRVVATRLRAIEAILRRLRALALFDAERGAVDQAREAMRKFMAVSPLASVRPLDAGALPRTLRAARRRPAEWRNVAGFHRWFDDFHAIDVARIGLLDSPDAITRGPAYELAVAAGTLIALAEGMDAGRWPPDGVRVTSATFGAHRRYSVCLARGGREAHLQARDLSVSAARDMASMLHPRCVLVVPSATPVDPPLFCVPVTALARLEVYAPILDALFARLDAPVSTA